jgi:hypothetical protein
LSGIGRAAGSTLGGAGKVLGDVAGGVGKAAGGYVEGVGNRYRDMQILRELQVVQQTTPENTPARIKATRGVLNKYGMSMPAAFDEKGVNQYQVTPVPKASGALDPVQRAKAVAGLMGQRPFSGDEGDVYDPQNPVHSVWMRSLQELEGPPGAGGSAAAPTAPTGERPGIFETARDTLGIAAGGGRNVPVGQGRAIASIPDEPGPMPRTPGAFNQWSARQAQRPPAAPETPAPSAPRTPGAGIFSRMVDALGRGGDAASRGQVAQPSPEQVDAALTQAENAGAVTTRNVAKVQQSQAAPADTLRAAARAVKAYHASPEYIEMTGKTGRLLNETDLSGPMKEALAGQAAADQKRLLKLIHQHGEAKVLAAMQKNAKPKGNF